MFGLGCPVVSDYPPPPPPSSDPVPPPPSGLTPPPGYVAYQGQPTPTTPLGRVDGLRKAIVILTVILIVGTILTAIFTTTATDAADDFLAGNLSEDDFLADYVPALIGQGIAGIAQLALAVLSIIWLFRLAKNLRTFGRQTTWAPIWAVFGWILPPILIIIPFLMVREVWKASDPQSAYGTDSWKQSREPSSVIVWFAVYGIGSVLLLVLQAGSGIGQNFGGDTEDLAEVVSDFGTYGIASTLVTVAGAIAWIWVVRETTSRHTQLTGER